LSNLTIAMLDQNQLGIDLWMNRDSALVLN
jgi:hypothetical protein